MKQPQKPTILLTAGGTGGHVFPALALSQALQERGHATTIVTDQRGKRYLPDTLDSIRMYWIYPRGQGAHRFLQLISLMWVTLRMLAYMYRARPVAVIGFGGYTSLPALLAARFWKIPTVLHEQNAVLGKVNRWLGRFVQCIALGFPETRYANFPHQTVVGNPIRKELWMAAQETTELEEIREKLSERPGGVLHILVLGGSQGAGVFANIMPRVCQFLSPEQRQRLRFKHQVRREQQSAMQASYQELGITAEITPFFTHMAQAYQWADVVICRSGALTVSEVALFRKRAIFIPLPSSADDHQTANTQTLVAHGQAWCIPETPETAAAVVRVLIQLLGAEEAALPYSTPGILGELVSESSASRLAQVVEDLLAIK